MTSSRSLAALALALCAACAGGHAGGYHLTGGIRGNPGARSAAELVAVPGARVSLQCPNAAKDRELGEADTEGRLQLDGEGSVPLDCKLLVTGAGYRTVTYAVRDQCSLQGSGSCRALDVRAVLEPSGRVASR